MRSRLPHHPRLLAALALLVTSGALAQGEPPAVSLEEAVRRGLEVSPQRVDAQGSLTVAEAARRRAKGAYLPSLSAAAGTALSSSERFDPETSATVSGANASLNAGLSVGWDVYTGGRRKAQRDQAQAQWEAVRHGFVDTERNIVFGVTAAYYAALNVERLEGVAASRLERATAQLEAARKRAQMGAATKSDVLRAELEVHNARTQVVEVETLLRSARLELGRLIGVPQPVRALPLPEGQDVSSAPPWTLPSEEVEALVSAHPQVASFESQLVATRTGVTQAKAQWLPSVRLSGGYDWFTPLPEVTEGRTGWSVRLGLSVPLFDGWARNEQLTRAQVAVTTQSAQLDELRRTVRTELERALDQERLAAWRVDASRAAVEVAREDLRVQQERYAVGATTMLDLLTSQERLVQAETDAIDSQLARALARAELVALTGRTP